MRFVISLVILAIFNGLLSAQTTAIGVYSGGLYSENFDSMGTGSPVYAAGWNAYKITGTSPLANNGFITTSTTPAFTTSNGTGTNLSGNAFNLGSTGDSDRAFGTVASGSTTAGFGLLLRNDSGGTINLNTLSFTFTAEQWRLGDNSVTETVTFRYLTGASIDVNFTGGSTASALDLTEINLTNGTNTGIDGNATGNNVAYNVANPLTGTWLAGQFLAIRWEDANAAGADSILAIDNFQITGITPVPEPTTILGLSALGMAGVTAFRRRKMDAQPLAA